MREQSLYLISVILRINKVEVSNLVLSLFILIFSQKIRKIGGGGLVGEQKRTLFLLAVDVKQNVDHLKQKRNELTIFRLK